MTLIGISYGQMQSGKLPVEAFIVRCAQHWTKILTEAARGRTHAVRDESRLIDPAGDHGEVIRARGVLLEYVKALVAGIAAALFSDTLEQDFRFLASWRRNIDVRDRP